MAGDHIQLLSDLETPFSEKPQASSLRPVLVESSDSDDQFSESELFFKRRFSHPSEREHKRLQRKEREHEIEDRVALDKRNEEEKERQESIFKEIKGHAVLFPLHFLESESLVPSLVNVTGMIDEEVTQ